MREDQFKIIVDLLKLIEYNTTKEEKPLLSSPSVNIDTDKFFERFQKIFLDDLEFKTGWGKNEIKQLFSSAKFKAISGNDEKGAIDEGDLPWRR